MDAMGPISPETYDDEKYALTVLDEFSEMSATILLKSKAGVSREAVNLFHLMDLHVSLNCFR